MKTDIPLKRLTTLCGEDLLLLFDVPTASLISVETIEFPTTAVRLDNVLHVWSPGGQDYYHVVEWQGYEFVQFVGRKRLMESSFLSYLMEEKAKDLEEQFRQQQEQFRQQQEQLQRQQEQLQEQFAKQMAMQLVAKEAQLAAKEAQLIAQAEEKAKQAEEKVKQAKAQLAAQAEEKVKQAEARLIAQQKTRQTLEDTILMRFPQAPFSLLQVLRQIQDPDQFHDAVIAVATAPDLIGCEQLLRQAAARQTTV